MAARRRCAVAVGLLKDDVELDDMCMTSAVLIASIAGGFGISELATRALRRKNRRVSLTRSLHQKQTNYQ